jgi:hypothetical protein
MRFLCAVSIYVSMALCHHVNYKELNYCMKIYILENCVSNILNWLFIFMEYCPHKFFGLWDRCHLVSVTGFLKACDVICWA